MSSNTTTASICLSADNAFGPQLKGCSGQFDFTLLFEQSILSILPSALLLLLSPLRILQLQYHDTKTRRNSWYMVKMVSSTFSYYCPSRTHIHGLACCFGLWSFKISTPGYMVIINSCREDSDFSGGFYILLYRLNRHMCSVSLRACSILEAIITPWPVLDHFLLL